MNFKPLKNLSGQTAVITGAAGGVGWATAHTLSKSGAKIIGLVRRNESLLQQRLDQLPGGPHRAILADNTNSNDLARAASTIKRCDILINSAGWSSVIPHKNIQDLGDDFFDNILKCNLRSVYSTIRTFVPLLKYSSHGLIVNISSNAALKSGVGSNIAYAAAKAGLESITKNLALVLAPKIRVVSICPGPLNTGWLDLPAKYYQNVGRKIPLKRVGTADDIATAVEVIATKLRFTTGNCFEIDGGETLL